MQIREVLLTDIPKWMALSKEYDQYVSELVPDLTEWYQGNDTSISFDDYMKAKILQHEAFLPEDIAQFGIIAVSKKNNRITFFAISHNSDFERAGDALITHALSVLNTLNNGNQQRSLLSMIFSDTMLLTDLDGTLLNSNGDISRENREAVEYYIANGGLFSFATGRSLQGMHYFAGQIPVNAPGVIFNGSMAYDFAADRPLFFDPLPPEALAMMEDVSAAFPQAGIELYTQTDAFVIKMNDITRRHLNYVNIPITEGQGRDIPTPWVSLVVTHPREGIGMLADYISRQYPDTFFLQRSLSEYLEVQNKRSNKGDCALRLCRAMGIRPDNLYVIGDGTNDVQLLSCTKNIYAPANAVPRIMALSPKIVADNDNHGIAHMIHRIEQELQTGKDEVDCVKQTSHTS